MISAIVNTVAVLIGSTIGLCLQKLVNKDMGDPLIRAMGFVTLYIAITGVIKEGGNTMVLIIAMILGTLIGEALKLDDRLNAFGLAVENRFKKKDGKGVSIAEGFVSACFLFCMGAMTIVGSLQAGLVGDYSMIYTKSLMDLFSSIVFAATMGVGVLLSAGFVLVFQGAIVLLAQWIAPFLTTDIILQMTIIGNLILMALGFNLIGVTKIKVMNMVPAILLPIILCHFL